MMPPANPVVHSSVNAQSVQLGDQPTSVTLPVISQISGRLLFPAVDRPALISLSASATAPSGVALESLRRAQSGTLTVYEYLTIVSPITVSLPSLPAITLAFPSSTPLEGKSFYYGISDLNSQGGFVSFVTQGPGTINGNTVTFMQIPTAITFAAGNKYTFIVYATTKAAVSKIYVANLNANNVTTYNLDGSSNSLTITGLNRPQGIAIDAAGKIYVSNGGNNTVTTYRLDGTRTTPTITTGSSPLGIAVDATGKIYVVNNGDFTVTTYNADGSPSTPTISGRLVNFPLGVAVDARGKIYVSAAGVEGSYNAITSYKADGAATIPTITSGLNGPFGLTVDAAGKIYVANVFGNTVTTYNANGTRTTPTISVGLDSPQAVAVDPTGKIYVANFGGSGHSGTVSTYNADGSQTTPTITTGLFGPYAIAVH